MERSIRAGGIAMMLVLLLAACTGGGATQAPTTAPTSPPAAEPTPTEEPTEEPTATAEPTASAGPSVSATPSGEPTGAPSPSGEATPSTPGEPSPSPSPTAPPAAVEGTLTIWADEVRAPILETIGEQFTAEFDVPVAVYQLGFGDIRDKLVLVGPTGEGPDIIIGAHDWLGQLTESGLLAPLDLGDKADSIDPVGLEAFTYDGTLYGLPYASEAIALYYNTELVPEPPATWEELKTIAADLQESGQVEQGYVLQERDPYHSYPILTGMGGYIFAQDDEGNYDPSDVGLDSEGGIAYANELGQMVEDGLLRPDVDFDLMIELFNTERSAMFITGPWALPQIREGGVPFGVAPIPTMAEEPRPFVGVQGFMVSADAPNQLLAETFLTEYMATDEGMQALFDADPRPPTWLPIAESLDDPEVAAFAESASSGDPLPAIPEMSSVWTAWTDALDLIFRQQADPEQAVTDAATEIRDLIEGQ